MRKYINIRMKFKYYIHILQLDNNHTINNSLEENYGYNMVNVNCHGWCFDIHRFNCK